jgi:phosphohistidine phosphatase
VDLYVIRHADAHALGERGVTDDAGRPLTEIGEVQAKAVGTALQARGVRLGMVVTSPLVRARQTAELILAQFRSERPVLQVAEELAPGGKPKQLARFLRKLGGEAVAVVGHQPDLGESTAWLIGSKKARIDLAKAGVALLACPDGPRKGGGSLVWLVTPDWYVLDEGKSPSKASSQ